MAAKREQKGKLDQYEFMTVKEFARRTTYNEGHVRRMLDSKEIESLKLGDGKGKRVIPVQAFIDFIEARKKA